MLSAFPPYFCWKDGFVYGFLIFHYWGDLPCLEVDGNAEFRCYCFQNFPTVLSVCTVEILLHVHFLYHFICFLLNEAYNLPVICRDLLLEMKIYVSFLLIEMKSEIWLVNEVHF